MRTVAALLVLAACSNRPSKDECEKVADRMIEIFVAPRVPESGNVPTEAAKDSEAWKKNLLSNKDPTRGALVETCRGKMSSGQAECARRAGDETSLAACFE